MDGSRHPESPIKIPFALALYRLWRSGSSGRLKLQGQDGEFVLDLDRGLITVTSEMLDRLSFDKHLLRRKIVKTDEMQACRQLAAEKGISVLRALLQRKILKPERLWELMEEFVCDCLFLLFDWEEAACGFEPGRHGPESISLLILSVPDIIVRGIRRMRNSRSFRSHLPGPEETFHAQIPGHFQDIPLSPPERYVLSLVNGSRDLKSLYASSELGEDETRRALFLLVCLGLIDAAPIPQGTRPPVEISLLDVKRLLDRLNKKLAAVFRYVSKEIGPVALNALEKGLEEIRGDLSPALADVHLTPDGRLDMATIPGSPVKLTGPEASRDLLRDLNEILAAEILVVKKILGDQHESILVRAIREI